MVKSGASCIIPRSLEFIQERYSINRQGLISGKDNHVRLGKRP